MSPRPIADLTLADFAQYPVWEFDLKSESLPGRDETWVLPVLDLPVHSLSNRVVSVSLKIGQQPFWGILGNVDLNDLLASREFTTLTVWIDHHWFHLARYFDIGRDQSGPEQMAAKLGLPVSAVFPIRYDLTGLAIGLPEVIRGQIEAEPDNRLTASQRMELIFKR